MSLLSYFSTKPQELPNPAGPLSVNLSSSSIEEANAVVTAVREGNSPINEKQGPYVKMTDELRAKIGKYASENGNSAAARHFSTLLSKPISRATVHEVKMAYY